MRGRLTRPAPGLLPLLSLACLVPLAACGGSSAGVAGDQNPAFSATASPVASLAPSTDVPRDFRPVAGKGYSISAPSVFQQVDATSANGQPTIALRRPSSVPESPSGVVIIRDVDPKQDVVQQMYALEVSKRALKATDVVRSDVVWPGARRAVIVRWTQQAAAAKGSTVEVRYVQLSAQIDDGLILSVVAVTPVPDSGTSQVVDVLRTFRPAAAAAAN
jgi:hypothetical protein